MPYCKLAIVGGGPKSAAIAAKAWAIRQHTHQRLDICVTIFERSRTGAAWDGAHGFTDGDQMMCTGAERDIGFPYEDETFGAPVNALMVLRFSWQAYAVATKRYGDWVDNGRRRLPHRVFAEYVSHCIREAGAEEITGDVIGLRRRKEGWRVKFLDVSTGTSSHRDGFDGVVVTGTGPARRRFHQARHPLILDGEDFWQEAKNIPQRLKTVDSDLPIAVLGSGGTAAAVAFKLHRMGLGRQISMIGSQPTLFARVDSSFENRLFRDGNLWSTLGPDERKAFTDRLTRGAVWANVIEELVNADLDYLHGTVKSITTDPLPGLPDELMVEFQTSAEPTTPQLLPAALIVDTTGFDGLWFADLLPGKLRGRLRRDANAMRAGMDDALRLPIELANLHAPGLSETVGPAFTSLMGLGTLSDAVLAPYIAALDPSP